MKTGGRIFATLAAVSIASIIIGCTVVGCTVGPDYHRPQTQMPASFAPQTPQTQPSTRPADLARWWKSLDDAELNSLIHRAISSNLDLEIAFARLQEARLQEMAVTGASLPSIGLTGAAARGTGTDSVKSRTSSILDSATDSQGLREITEIAGADAVWNLDIFGKYRREIQAAHADTLAAAEFRNAVLIALLSDVAQAYFDARTFQLRLDIANDDVRAEQRTLDLVQDRFHRGLTTELDVALAKRQLATVQSRVSLLQDGISQSRRRVAVLLGLFPEELTAELNGPAILPTLSQTIEPGLPVALLERRPDIRLAEWQLAAQTARIGVATANLFPSVILAGAAGIQEQGLGRSPQKSMSIWSIGPGAYWPILDFGTLDALVGIEDFRTREAALNYRRTILNAVEEVNNAISQYDAQRLRLVLLHDALDSSQRAVDLASKRYEDGLTDFLNVLDALRQYYDLKDQLAEAQEAMVLQYINVYKGLGGGWEDYAPGAPPPAPQPAIIAAGQRLAKPAPQNEIDAPK